MRSAAGWKPAGPCPARLWGGTTDLRHFCVPVAQQQSSRSITGRSKVRILPGIPISITPSGGPGSRRHRLKADQLRVRVLAGGPTGRRSGRARRDPVLTGSCHHRVAWGASPPSSAIFCGVACGRSGRSEKSDRSADSISFSTLSSNQTGRPAFNRQIRGQIPAGWPFFAQVAQSEDWNGVGSAASAGASPALSTLFWTASFAAKQLAFNQRSTGQHRGGSFFNPGNLVGLEAHASSPGRVGMCKKEQTPPFDWRFAGGLIWGLNLRKWPMESKSPTNNNQ